MSTTALTTVVGGVVGFFLGGPTGAMYGAQAGFVAGSLLDPPKAPAVSGPRLGDLSVQTSTYGAALPRIYGTVATHGNVIWLQGNKLTEKVKKTSQGGKGGSDGTTVKTYSYYATFAVGLADTSKTGPIEAVRRVWVGGKLLYDAGSDDLEAIVASNQAASGFRIYYGGEDQEPDPRMQADVGADKCSAFRGVAYIVFYDFPLKNYGNSLMAAQVKVELVAAGGYAACPVRYYPDPATPATYTEIAMAHDDGTLLLATEQPGYLIDGRWTGGRVERRTLDCQFLAVEKVWPEIAVTLSDGSTRTFYAFTPSLTDPLRSAAYRTVDFPTLHLIVNNGVPYPEAGYIRQWAIVADAGGASYTLFNNRLVKVRSGFLEAEYFFAAPNSTGWGLICSESNVYVNWPSSGGSGWSIYEFDLDLQLTGEWPGYDIVSPNPASPAMPTPIGPRQFFGRGAGSNTLGVITLNDDHTISLSCSHATDQEGWRARMPTGSGIIYAAWINGTIRRIYAGAGFAPGATWLEDILQSECLQSGLLSVGDLDTSDIHQEVRGYRVSENGAIRGALEPLQAAWPFDVVQSGYKIKFVRRGKSPVAAIASGELDARPSQSAPGVQIAVSTEMDTQLPRRVMVRYLDVGREYDLSEQEAERLNTDAVNQQALDLPLVLNATEAAGMAEVLLYLRWLERREVALQLPPAYRYLEPADVITVAGDWGSYELRLTRVNLESDGRLACSAKFNSAPVYTPVAEGAEGEVPEQTISVGGPSRFALLDVPLLSDDLNSPGWPAAMTGYLDGWPGGVIYRSDDGGQTWNDVQAFTGKATVGVGRDVLAPGRTDIVDSASVLTVDMLSGELSSIDELAQLNGGNLCAYGLPGRWEILAPRTAVQNPDGSLTLSDWMRGRFGTEWAAGLHQAGDVLVLLTDPDIAWIGLNSASIGLPRLYRGITAGQSISSGDSTSWTYEGVNFKPLSPVYLNGNRHPSSRDWALTWIRRGRVSPEWRNSVDVPVGEAAEAYDVEIYDGASYATVKRTISVAAASVGYTSAQQVADFGSNQGSLYVKIYQISATVGRGYPLTAAITRS